MLLYFTHKSHTATLHSEIKPWLASFTTIGRYLVQKYNYFLKIARKYTFSCIFFEKK